MAKDDHSLDGAPMGCISAVASQVLLFGLVAILQALDAWEDFGAAVFATAAWADRVMKAMYEVKVLDKMPLCAPAVVVFGIAFATALFKEYRGRYLVVTVVYAVVSAMFYLLLVGGIRRLLGYS